MKYFTGTLFAGAFWSGLALAQTNANPYIGREFFVSPTYRANTARSAANFTTRGDARLAAAALKVGEVPTSLWVSDTATIKSIDGWLKEAQTVQTQTGKKQIVVMQVYNLPDRDCSAKASAGELIIAEGGEEKYKSYIQQVKAEFLKYPDVHISVGLETDSTGNMVTSLGNEKCKNAEATYKRCLAYAISELQLDNVSLYLDAAHAGWIGSNIPAAVTFIEGVIKGAQAINPNAKIRGLQTNVANYNGLGVGGGRDELVFTNNFAQAMRDRGIEVHFLVDQGRSGVPSTGGPWCNWKGAGFGPRPTSDTGSPNIDAIVWIKPGGDSDGTSDKTAKRYDENCGSADSLQPAPEAGEWFPAYFEQLINNAKPSFF